MRSALSQLELLRPRELKEALALRSGDLSIVPIAGCTDVFVSFQMGLEKRTRFLDLSRLAELSRIEERGEFLSIGAAATYRAIQRAQAVQGRLPILVAASREIGGPQIQNRGTLGGNIANGSPAGDSLPVLAVCEATLVLASHRGERRVPFTSFYTGYRKSILAADELIVAIEFPRVAGKQWFRKVGTRAAQAISKVALAGIASHPPRLAIGSVAPTVIRLPGTEDALASGRSIDLAVEVLQCEIAPIDDIRSTAAYRRRVAGNLLRQFWRECGAGDSR